MINTFIKPFGQEISGLPAWPIFETIVGAILISAPSTTSSPSAARRMTSKSADAVDRRSRHRLAASIQQSDTRRDERSSRRGMSGACQTP